MDRSDENESEISKRQIKLFLKSRRLIINMDVNKTIIMSDSASEKDVDAVVNGILSENVYGEFNPSIEKADRNITHFEILSVEPSNIIPESKKYDGPVVSFAEFLENYTDLTKSERKEIKNNFTITVGQQFRSTFEKVISHLTIPATLIETSESESKFYQIIPAFFKMIAFLNESECDFRIVFRTFGDDILNIISEYNSFCNGEHPFLPLEKPMNGENGSIDRRIDIARSSGYITRSNETPDGIHFYKKDVADPVATDAGMFYQMLQGWFDDENIHAVAIRDYYRFWALNAESDTSGKLLLVDNRRQDEVQLFFDDNIERDRAHIVDVRDVSTFESIPFELTKDKTLVRADPLSAILDEDYFIKAILKALAK